MISTLLSMHPEVLSLSEAFIYTAPDGLQTERMTGNQFAGLCLSKNVLVSKALRARCRSVMRRFGAVDYLLNPGNPLLRRLVHGMERVALRALLETVDLRTFVDDAEVTVAHMGWLWNDLVMRGDQVLRGVPAERRLDLKFEDVQAAPREQLERLIRFIDPSLVDESWLRQASAVPRAARSSYRALPEDEQTQLTEVCRPALELLGYPC